VKRGSSAPPPRQPRSPGRGRRCCHPIGQENSKPAALLGLGIEPAPQVGSFSRCKPLGHASFGKLASQHLNLLPGTISTGALLVCTLPGAIGTLIRA
jgi:hypothetical protein